MMVCDQQMETVLRRYPNFFEQQGALVDSVGTKILK